MDNLHLPLLPSLPGHPFIWRVCQYTGCVLLNRRIPLQVKESDPSSIRRRYDQLEMDGDEDDEGLVEQAAHQDREWDDWKDMNPRGAGNKANKIM